LVPNDSTALTPLDTIAIPCLHARRAGAILRTLAPRLTWGSRLSAPVGAASALGAASTGSSVVAVPAAPTESAAVVMVDLHLEVA